MGYRADAGRGEGREVNDAPVVLAWLVLAHLVADFVLQNDAIATAKFGDGPEAWRALGIHGLIVGALTLPLVAVYGLPGLLYGALTVVSHVAIDRIKVVLTRRVEPASATGSAPTAEDAAKGPTFDRAWSPVPGALFAADQAAHLGVILVGWAILLARHAPLQLLESPDVRQPILLIGVLAALLIVNIRAASLFVANLVRLPLSPGEGSRPSSARVGAVIGILERLLICALVLGGAVATIGLVIAAKTLARFKQLDDREFAEYYLLGTLASVTVAIATSLLAQAALAS